MFSSYFLKRREMVIGRTDYRGGGAVDRGPEAVDSGWCLRGTKKRPTYH